MIWHSKNSIKIPKNLEKKSYELQKITGSQLQGVTNLPSLKEFHP